MRPIATNAGTASYSKAEQLDRDLFELGQDGGAERPAKRRRVQSASVGSKAEDLNTLLVEHWDPTHSWDSGSSRQKANRLFESMGTGYTAATRSLINQTGQYCAFCDAPLYSGLQAEPALPAAYFPSEAFDYELQLLTCGPCRSAKQKNLTRANGSAAELRSPNTLAWPQLFAQALADGEFLPFRYRLAFIVFGQPGRGRLLREDEVTKVIQLYRRGDVQVDRSSKETFGWVRVNLPDGKQYFICAWLEATSTGRPVEVGVTNLINVLELNAVDRQQTDGWLDRRLELRTMAWLRATDLYNRLHGAWAGSDLDLFNKMEELLPAAIQATGFWGVWLSVFRNVGGFQAQLATWMPGTAAQSWVL